MQRFVFSILVACLVVAARHAEAAAAPVADPPVAVLAPADAADHVGEECTVELTVEGARKLPGKQICFLNSCRDHRDERNFTVVIFKAGLDRLEADGIENPAEHFKGTTIRVHGVIEKRDGRPQLVVEEPGQISVVKPAEQTATQVE
jgi:DNA/RNA endonuclease YhcR with UshA esterase domain